MSRIIPGLLLLFPLFLGNSWLSADAVNPKSPRKALEPFNELIGRWKGTGIPTGSQGQAGNDFWIETMDWSWKFQGQDAWLTVTFEKGRDFVKGELRYLPAEDRYQFTVQTGDKKALTFEGAWADRRLTLVREDPERGEKQQLVIRLLHPNRFLYSYAVLPKGRTLFQRVFQVGATREGVEFASGDGRPECVVSGGLGTIAVTYQGKTYYVCCGGCRDEFTADPEKYVREYEQKKAEKKGNP